MFMRLSCKIHHNPNLKLINIELLFNKINCTINSAERNLCVE